jgi:uncharacterized Zn finger protein
MDKRKTDIECPFCRGFFLNFQKEITTDSYYECFLSCGNCGFELVGRKDFDRKKVEKKSDKKKYEELFNKFHYKNKKG